MNALIIFITPLTVFAFLAQFKQPTKKTKVKRKKWKTVKNNPNHVHIKSQIFYKNKDTGHFTNRFDKRGVQCR